MKKFTDNILKADNNHFYKKGLTMTQFSVEKMVDNNIFCKNSNR